MSGIGGRLREFVAKRAANRCEYCRLSQTGQEATFHVDHVIPLAAGGPTDSDNLALACVSCSLRKGARMATVDPRTRRSVTLYNPRRETWSVHFRWHGVRVQGRTPTGRATIATLRMNRPLALAIRREEAAWQRHPPPEHSA